MCSCGIGGLGMGSMYGYGVMSTQCTCRYGMEVDVRWDHWGMGDHWGRGWSHGYM